MKKNTFKKLIALILGVVMLSSVVLTSCKKEEEEVNAEYRTPYSFVMTVVCEKPVSAETEKLVEDAFNAITESKFKTRVDLRFYTEDVYFDTIANTITNFLQQDTTASTKPAQTEAGAAVEEETIINEEYGYSEFKYPEIKENQLDIIYISGADMYYYLVNGNSADKSTKRRGSYLAGLDSALSTGSKVLNDYIFPEYFEAVKVNGLTYAVPANGEATDYTYMLVNKELSEKYQYSTVSNTWTSLASAKDYISDIAKYEGADVLPIFGKLEPINTFNWNYELKTLAGQTSYTLDHTRFSVFGSPLMSTTELKTVLRCGETLSDSVSTSYIKQLALIQDYKEMYRNDDKDMPYTSETLKEGQKFALGFIKGDEGDVAAYREDYDVVVVETPKITNESVFGNMFGVFSNVSNDDPARVNRCMEVITLLNTDVELRNILQYGVEGVHYTIDSKTGVLHRLNQDYMMDVNKTGNLLLAHAEEGQNPKAVEYIKLKSIDACLLPSINVMLDLENVDLETVAATNERSRYYEEKLKNVKSSAELNAVIEEFKSDTVVDNLRLKWIDAEAKLKTPYGFYYKWLESVGAIDSED